MNNHQTSAHPKNLAARIVKDQRNAEEKKRIFLKVDTIKSIQGQHTFAHGWDLKTNQYISIRLNTAEERANDLVKLGKLTYDQALKTAKNLYTGSSSSSRESLNDKRDKRKAIYLAFDDCQQLEINNNVTIYRSHWSELMSNKSNCAIFEGMAYLHVRAGAVDELGFKTSKDVAHLNIIEQVRTLKMHDFESNSKYLKASLATNYKNGMPRTGYAIFQIFDNETGDLIAESYFYQNQLKTEVTDPKRNEKITITRPNDSETSIKAFINEKYEGEPNQMYINRDLLRVLMPLLFNIGVNKEALYRNDKEYLKILTDFHNFVKSGNYTVKMISIHQVYIGSERRNYLIRNKDKGVIKSYTKELNLPPNTQTIKLFIPTVFVLQFHPDSGNPFVAYNILSNLKSDIKPTELHLIPDNIFGFNYRPLFM